MKRIWALFFMIWPVLAVWVCWVAPKYGWWFPTTVNADGTSSAPLGRRIDELFSLILYITATAFIGTQIGLGYVLWKSSKPDEDDVDETGAPRKAWYSTGSHSLEVLWSIVPAGALLFIALYQMDVWAEFRIQDAFPQEQLARTVERLGMNPNVTITGSNGESRVVKRTVLAEVTARQFEWRIRYPGFDPETGELLPLQPEPQKTDLYDVNELHLPSGAPALIELKSEDVQHSFFVPELRVKQDAVPGLVIPIWMQADQSTTYSLTCAELCGWGHYKMRASVVTHPPEEFLEYLKKLHREQFDDGFQSEQELATAAVSAE